MEGLTRVISVSRLSAGVFAVALERPAGFRFQPGQSIILRHGQNERSYSISSGPDEDRLLLCVRLIEGGALSPRLIGAQPGDIFPIDGPHGYFLFQRSARQAVFVATGTGVAPFLSMMRAGARGFVFLHGVRDGSELCYRDEMSAAARPYVPCLSADPIPGVYHGRVTGWASAHLAPGSYDFYLCGNRDMIRDLTILADERFAGSRVFTEVFF